jgi:hypothetical protein
MSTFTYGGQRLSALAANAIATTSGGAMDAWVYLAHGHVFANAQTGHRARRWGRRGRGDTSAFALGFCRGRSGLAAIRGFAQAQALELA